MVRRHTEQVDGRKVNIDSIELYASGGGKSHEL
jgi:hypothetical protein